MFKWLASLLGQHNKQPKLYLFRYLDDSLGFIVSNGFTDDLDQLGRLEVLVVCTLEPKLEVIQTYRFFDVAYVDGVYKPRYRKVDWNSLDSLEKRKIKEVLASPLSLCLPYH